MEIIDFQKNRNNGDNPEPTPETPLPSRTESPPAPVPPPPKQTPEDARRVNIARKVVMELFGPQMFQSMKELQAITMSALQKQCTQMTVSPQTIQALIQMNGSLALELGNRILKESENAKIQTRPSIIVP